MGNGKNNSFFIKPRSLDIKILAPSILDKKIIFIFGFLIIAFVFQTFYFYQIYHCQDFRLINQNFDLVVTFGEDSSYDDPLDLSLARNKPLFVSLSPLDSQNPFIHRPSSDLKKVHLDFRANTTDQNAKYAADFIRKGGFKNVVLDVAWFHAPRSLFLIHLYLFGSGVRVFPCFKTPIPSHWWNEKLLYQELYKFWGSLGRVVLNFFGLKNGFGSPSVFMPLNNSP